MKTRYGVNAIFDPQKYVASLEFTLKYLFSEERAPKLGSAKQS